MFQIPFCVTHFKTDHAKREKNPEQGKRIVRKCEMYHKNNSWRDWGHLDWKRENFRGNMRNVFKYLKCSLVCVGGGKGGTTRFILCCFWGRTDKIPDVTGRHLSVQCEKRTFLQSKSKDTTYFLGKHGWLVIGGVQSSWHIHKDLQESEVNVFYFAILYRGIKV